MTKSRVNFFNDLERDAQFDQQGYLIEGAISPESIKKLTDVFTKLNIPDSYGFGFNVGLNTDEHVKRKAMQDEITAIIETEVTSILNDKFVFTATFMNKIPEKKHLLPPHQDWTYTNEDVHDSVMCWIPLIDVDMDNGCMCFVPHSNQLFNYTRPFPFPFPKNPVYQHANKLIGYMRPEPMKAGQMVFINHKTAHASFPNWSADNRLAIGLSIAPKSEDLHVYCLNPENKGETIFKYMVDRYFLVNHNHPSIAMQYRSSQKYDFVYEVEEEATYTLPEISWEQVADFLEKRGVVYDEELYQLSVDFEGKPAAQPAEQKETVVKKDSWYELISRIFKPKTKAVQ